MILFQSKEASVKIAWFSILLLASLTSSGFSQTAFTPEQVKFGLRRPLYQRAHSWL